METADRKTILVFSFTDHASDPHENRQIRYLNDAYHVISVGLGDPGIDGVRFHSAFRTPSGSRRGRLRKAFREKAWKGLLMQLFHECRNLFDLGLRRYESYYWNKTYIQEALQVLSSLKFDLIIAHDIETLPVALRASGRARVIFDAHEYYPGDHAGLFWKGFHRPFIGYLCRKFLPQADGVFTVCESIAEAYRKEFDVNSQILMNTPDYHSLPVKPTDPERIRIVHHGAVMEDRKIETMIEVMQYLDKRFEMDLILIGGKSRTLKKIRKKAAAHPNIRFLEPVPMMDIVSFCSQYDIGLFLLPPTNFNYRVALPNKFFEFIQSRLALAIGPSVEMEKIVKQWDCGVIAESFEPDAMASKLNQLDAEQIDRMKMNSHRIARQFSSEENRNRLMSRISELLQKKE